MFSASTHEANILFEGIALTLSSLGAVKGFEFIEDKLVIRLDEFSGILCLEKTGELNTCEPSLQFEAEDLRPKKRSRYGEIPRVSTVCQAAQWLDEETTLSRSRKAKAVGDANSLSYKDAKPRDVVSQGRTLRRGVRQMQLDEKLAKQLQMEEEKSARQLKPK